MLSFLGLKKGSVIQAHASLYLPSTLHDTDHPSFCLAGRGPLLTMISLSYPAMITTLKRLNL